MKIAFVGKGGSGKSTISSAFVAYLLQENQKIVAVDADINQHFAAQINAPFKPELALALDNNKAAIRQYLVGDNPRITGSKQMVKTTPPGRGSKLVVLNNDNKLLQQYATKFSDNGYFMHVGTYESDGIGMSCYHTSLSIFENILSHTPVNAADEWVVADMVAGTDAFSGPLHAMFDLLCVVVEPTVESVSVYKQFIGLAQAAGVDSRVRIIANKIDDHDDESYIEQETGTTILASIAYDPALRRRAREAGTTEVSKHVVDAMRVVASEAVAVKRSPAEHLAELQKLHKVFARQKFTIDKYGDTLGHIDTEFNF